jgi:ankyrin repeat protein
MVKLLLEKGADATIQEKTGKTALSIASSRGQENVVRMLKESKPSQ